MKAYLYFRQIRSGKAGMALAGGGRFTGGQCPGGKGSVGGPTGPYGAGMLPFAYSSRRRASALLGVKLLEYGFAHQTGGANLAISQENPFF